MLLEFDHIFLFSSALVVISAGVQFFSMRTFL